jgi:hypothetical protein
MSKSAISIPGTLNLSSNNRFLVFINANLIAEGKSNDEDYKKLVPKMYRKKGVPLNLSTNLLV